MLRIGLLGLGTVGGGVIKILRERADDFEKIVGQRLELVKVMSRRSHRLEELGLEKSLYTDNFDEFLNTPMDILVEAIGGDAPSEVVKTALKKGCKVVTANKALLATKSQELMGSSDGHSLFFEASCCGGIPIISSFEEGLLSNKMEQLLGIFNGTCNYILTEMTEKDVSFPEVLKVAQELGYAEADPTFDVEGIDATHKLCLLGSLAFKKKIEFSDIPVQGITKLTPRDFKWAKDNGFVIKLISMAEQKNVKDQQEEQSLDTQTDEQNHQIFAATFPCLIPAAHPLANVNGANNAVFVKGAYTGDLMFYGAGAGELPTASAVVSDILAAAQGKDRAWSHHVFNEGQSAQLNSNHGFSYYIRLMAKDEVGVLSKLCDAYGKRDISLRSVIQNPASNGEADITFITHSTTTEKVEAALSEMQEKGWVSAQPFTMRILEI
jgi:homoserine dehydrogenase